MFNPFSTVKSELTARPTVVVPHTNGKISAAPPVARTPIVQTRDVVKSFAVGDHDLTILQGVSLDIHDGEFVAIVGPSGNGKSTLLNMMTGIDRPSSGELHVTGRPLHAMSENDLAIWRGENLGIIFSSSRCCPH